MHSVRRFILEVMIETHLFESIVMLLCGLGLLIILVRALIKASRKRRGK
jgi:hypothetical protein